MIAITAALVGHNVSGWVSLGMVIAAQELIAENVPGLQGAMRHALVRSGAPVLAAQILQLDPLAHEARLDRTRFAFDHGLGYAPHWLGNDDNPSICVNINFLPPESEPGNIFRANCHPRQRGLTPPPPFRFARSAYRRSRSGSRRSS